MIEKATWEDTFFIWKNYLWPNRPDPIEPISAMLFMGGYGTNHTPSFFCIRNNDAIIAINSGHECEDGTYRSRGLWVDPVFRKQGLGTKLLSHTIQYGIKSGYNLIWSLPRITSKSVYINAGFEICSDWFATDTSDKNAYCKYTYN